MEEGTFEEFDSFAVDDADSVFEFRVVAQEFSECNAFWTWRRRSLCSCLLRHFRSLSHSRTHTINEFLFAESFSLSAQRVFNFEP